VGVSPLSAEGRLLLYPNPSTGQITIENAKGCEASFINLLAQQALHSTLTTDRQVLDISALPKGIYVVQVVDVATGEKVVKRVSKE
jgi:competence protein ComGC